MGKFWRLLNEAMQDIGFEMGLFVAGCIGAISNIDNQKLKRWEKILAFISGGAIANYITPLIYIYLNLNKNTMFGIAFLLGFSGMEGVKYVIASIKSIVKNRKK